MSRPLQRVFWSVLAVAVATACSQSSDAQQTTETSSAAAQTSTVTETVTDTATPATSTANAPDEFQATLIHVQETQGSTTIDVQLPQVTGGPEAARDRFNTGMRTALDELVSPDADVTVNDGGLFADESSRVATITPTVVAGVAIFNWYSQGAAHPNNSVATITIAVESAQPVLLSDVFVDQQAAADRLADAIGRLAPRAEPLPQPSIDEFLNWIPTEEGFHVYVSVAHAMGDYLPVTVPWDEITDLMTPEMRTVLVS